jgi:protoheme IX farnesyltransferase
VVPTRFAKYVWLVLLYNLAAVAWGVFVRAGKYGDGCGAHWPLCDGASTPLEGDISRLVEASHRISTALIGPMAIVMVVWAFLAFPKGHLARKGAVATFVGVIIEGLIGAALVKFGWVTTNDSAARAAGMAIHAVSTFFLLGAITVTLLAGAGLPRIRLKGQGTVGWMIALGAVSIVMLGISGAISALGHQLHETTDVLKAAMNPATHWMVRLQPWHPFIAASIGLYLLLAAGLLQHLRPDPRVVRASRWVVGLFAAQLLLGLANIWLKAPIPMQMAHLVVADINWISLVVLGAFCFSDGVEHVENRPAPAEAEHVGPLKGRDLMKAYVALTKPRVISLLLFTTLTSMIAAKGEWPGFWLFLAVGIGGYAAAGAANTINMVIDRDIDLTMKRTSTRPTVTQSIPSTHALTFAFTLAGGSFALLWSVANLLSAVLAFSGLVFYVVVYTMLLKRRTWHNIVIGGAAGAFPPLVGWAAVTGDLPPLALYLFAIIFVWTPVHFWALAILLKDDYAAAGVPMLPVVKSERFTVIQIALYTVVTVVATMVPYFMPQVGWIYGLAALVLNALLVRYCVRLFKTVDRPRASGLFHYSMLYLALLFLSLAVDRAVFMTGSASPKTGSVSFRGPDENTFSMTIYPERR